MRIHGCGPRSAGAEQHGRVKLLVRCAKVYKQFQHFIDYLVDSGVGTVYFVYRHNNAVTQLHGASQHKSGLGHGTLGGVYQQDNAVYHFEYALHLAAEIGVPGSVHYVDFNAFVIDGGVFCKNSNAALSFQVAGVHNSFLYHLVFVIFAALLQHFVHEGGLTVVDMGDYCYISQVFSNHSRFLRIYYGFFI